MDPENDERPGGGEPAAAASPPSASAATALEIVQGGACEPVAREQSLPLPLTPSGYVQPTAPLRPSIAATLPPPIVELIHAQVPQLRITPEVVPVFDPTRLTLAPEVHFARSESYAGQVEPNLSPRGQVGRIEPTLEPAATSQIAAASVTDLQDKPRSAAPPVSLKLEHAVHTRTAEAERTTRVAPPRAEPFPALGYLKSALKIAGFAVAGYLALIVFLIFAYRFVNPPMSSLMLQQWISGQAVAQSWADIGDISPQVVRAVLLSEDGRFCDHTGVDFDAMQDAIERAGDGAPRGASTISMQVVKNLFLWPSKSYVRKAIEIPLTWSMELVWPKRRIMEIYLNIAEWGPGIFGVEAASQFHFQKSARRLNEREAAQLAVSLPNPYLRDAGDPGPKTRRLAGDIQSRMRNAYASQTACVLAAGAGR